MQGRKGQDGHLCLYGPDDSPPGGLCVSNKAYIGNDEETERRMNPPREIWKKFNYFNVLSQLLAA